ncbi:MAG: hypothetical protein COA43_14575 [Robiginitomaculum sp.]|nr:MAG: hypothetical protein COA43_14575 [Robiginitomaculum sp.]
MIKFNKELKSNRGSNEPTIIFRKLKRINDNNRFQGHINKKGIDLILTLTSSDNFTVQVLFSDEHSIIGLKPCEHASKTPIYFGATELFKELNLVIGKHYSLTINSDIATIDSDEHK